MASDLRDRTASGKLEDEPYSRSSPTIERD